MDDTTTYLLTRIAEALERMSPPRPHHFEIKDADHFFWNAQSKALQPVDAPEPLPLELLKGVDEARDTLLANTQQFASGFPANNVLLWGARGMGKSSLVKSVHGAINAKKPSALALIEIHREDLDDLPQLMHRLRGLSRRFILFCDDLSFDPGDVSYKSLKTALEGGIEGRPENVLFYATSNRRHLMPREMIENEQRAAINESDAQDEKVSLSDRFGLWIGFHRCQQETYLEMVENYATYIGVKVPKAELHRDALLWAATRGARSGRVAWQFTLDLAGRMQKKIS